MREMKISDDILFGGVAITIRVTRIESTFLVHEFHVFGQIEAIIELPEASIARERFFLSVPCPHVLITAVTSAESKKVLVARMWAAPIMDA